jgi:hypothetical protein
MPPNAFQLAHRVVAGAMFSFGLAFGTFIAGDPIGTRPFSAWLIMWAACFPAVVYAGRFRIDAYSIADHFSVFAVLVLTASIWWALQQGGVVGAFDAQPRWPSILVTVAAVAIVARRFARGDPDSFFSQRAADRLGNVP